MIHSQITHGNVVNLAIISVTLRMHLRIQLIVKQFLNAFGLLGGAWGVAVGVYAILFGTCLLI